MRVHLTKQQQLDLCKHRRTQHPHPSLQELATWAQVTFKHKRPPSKAMVSRVLRQEPVLQTLTPDELQRRRTQQQHVAALDAMMLEAIAFFEDGHVALNGRLIIWLARRCADRLQIPMAARVRAVGSVGLAYR
uniref:ARS-binding protein 1 N-terminal domain-containing protein n=1 Tax=Phytophthora fragariae TaxID=53985 RepID=A0A6A3EJ19_9STRA|nr:hypothetical protein PF009_g16538 [Phytophthora fragariae]